MNSVPQVAPTLQTEGLDERRMRLQALLLKKSLEVQQEQTAELQQMAEGKGSVIDIRV